MDKDAYSKGRTTGIDARRGAAAFTLTQTLLAIGIVAMLAAVAAPSLRTARENARIKQAEVQVDILAAACAQLAADTGKWPGGIWRYQASSKEVWDLTVRDAGLLRADGDFPNWKGPYLHEIPLDPWGMPYFFDCDYRHNGVMRPAVGSFGPNKAGRNWYDADDIYFVMD